MRVQRARGGGGRLPRRRRQRRPRPARRRRRDLGRLGHRRRQGRRRRHPAGEGPRRPRRRRRRGAADLRQHHQVRADGHVEQLRQHVQRRRRRRCSCRSCRCCPARSCSTTCSTTPASSPSRPTTSTRSSCARPSHWDIGFIRRFMIFFGPLSSRVRLPHLRRSCCGSSTPGAAEFRSGWFVESLATQTLVIFAIRTRRIPFFRSHPSLPLVLAAARRRARRRGCCRRPRWPTPSASARCPWRSSPRSPRMVVGYLVLIEVGKTDLLPRRPHGPPVPGRSPSVNAGFITVRHGGASTVIRAAPSPADAQQSFSSSCRLARPPPSKSRDCPSVETADEGGAGPHAC